MILDHYTVHTVDLPRALAFYTDVLGLLEGYRPPFDGPPGAWLYGVEGRPVVHLYVGREDKAGCDTAVDHIAFRVQDVTSTMERLQQHRIEFDEAVVPALGARQVFFRDPDGILIEINFEASSK